MRGCIVILTLAARVALIGDIRGQAAETNLSEGVVTLTDAQRKLLVIQNGDRARAFKLDGKLSSIQFGEQVRIRGQIVPYFSAFPDYPAHPAGHKILPAFEAPSDWNNHFLARLRGLLRVPADGDYTFWIMADDEAELLLGSNRDPATARMIASAPWATWPAAWDHDPKQKSQPIHLKKGESYYIEARQREWRGHDRLVVAWDGPTVQREVIGGEFLSPWDTKDGPTNGILYEYWTNCFITRFAVLTPQEQVFRVSGARVESLGAGQLPAARRVLMGEALSEVPSFAWVEVEGMVSFAAAENGVLNLELKESNSRNETAAARIRVSVLNWGNGPVASLLNRNIRARGVLEEALDSQGQPEEGILWVQDKQHLRPLNFPDGHWSELEVLPVFEITTANANLSWGRKVMVHGTVKSYDEKTGKVLLRGDDSFYAYSSTDGVTWIPFGTPVPVAMNDSILVGIAASSLTATQATEARFSQVGLDLSRSKTMGLSGDQVRGSVTISNGIVSLWPTTGNDWAGTDKGLFVCQSLQEEGEIVAHLESFNSTRISDKAGLMMRESSEADAPFVALVITHDTRLDLFYRQSRGSVAKAVQRVGTTVPRWLRLVRRQHELAAQLTSGQTLRVQQPVELVGLLNWTNGEPMLVDGYARSAAPAIQPAPGLGVPREVQVADLPSTTAESDQYLNQEVLLRGVVTFKGRVLDKEFLFLQDESGAVSLRASPAVFHSERIEPGCLLEVKGGVLFSPGTPPFRVNTATFLGSGVLPRPMAYPNRSEAKLAESHWVEAEGIVRSVTNNVMRVMERNGPLLVWVGNPGNSNALARYVDCLVTVRGPFSLQVADEPAVLVPSPRFIEVKESAPDDPFVIPSFAINKVGDSVDANLLHRVKITGLVTYSDERMLVVQDQTGGARVLGGEKGDVRLGDRVEAVGFANLEGEAVTMRESVVRKIGDAHSPEPIQMMMEGLIEARLNCWLVRLEGIVLDQKTRHGRQLLELQNGQRVFEAVLEKGARLIKPLPIGSRVQVTGVTQLQVASHSPATLTGRDLPLIATMDVLMRTPADLVLLERPPWWTWRHTASMGALLLMTLFAAMGWIRSLRRRVAQRTSELQVAMSRLQQETELSATMAERERLAAEIHDTVEQGLNGIMMQLDGMDSRLPGDAQGARQSLEMARRMVRFSRSEVRHSLWNLESPWLKEGNLSAVLTELARQMSAGNSVAVKVETLGTSRSLPAAVEHHLLRCAQESLNNALKHSQALEIGIELRYCAEDVEIVVADNGRGFEPEHVLNEPGRHLGLRNLRSRARKVKGQLAITSQPGKGTTVRLTVPLSSAEKAHGYPNSN